MPETVEPVPYDDAKHREIVFQAARDAGEMNITAIADALRAHGVRWVFTTVMDKTILAAWKECKYGPFANKSD